MRVHIIERTRVSKTNLRSRHEVINCSTPGIFQSGHCITYGLIQVHRQDTGAFDACWLGSIIARSPLGIAEVGGLAARRLIRSLRVYSQVNACE